MFLMSFCLFLSLALMFLCLLQLKLLCFLCLYVSSISRSYVFYVFMSPPSHALMFFMSLCLLQLTLLCFLCLYVFLRLSVHFSVFSVIKRILNRWLGHIFFLILQSVNQYSSIYGRLSRGKLQVLT